MRKRGTLAEVDKARADRMIAGLAGATTHTPIEEILDPGRNQVRHMHDDELAELLARNPHDKLGQLAASEMRSRESWRGPGKWSLIIAGLALLVSVGALFRTI